MPVAIAPRFLPGSASRIEQYLMSQAHQNGFSGGVLIANSNGNYVKFTITAAGFTITATPGAATDGNPRPPVNGIQIVPR